MILNISVLTLPPPLYFADTDLILTAFGEDILTLITYQRNDFIAVATWSRWEETEVSQVSIAGSRVKE